MHLLIKILILKYFFAVAVAVSKSLAGTSRKFGSKYRRFKSHQCFHITYNFSFWMKRIISRSIPTGPTRVVRFGQEAPPISKGTYPKIVILELKISSQECHHRIQRTKELRMSGRAKGGHQNCPRYWDWEISKNHDLTLERKFFEPCTLALPWIFLYDTVGLFWTNLFKNQAIIRMAIFDGSSSRHINAPYDF